MPKVPLAFDADALIRDVHKQDIGLRITTNDPRICKATLYKRARALGLKLHIFSYPRRPNSFALLKAKPNFAQQEEQPDA